MAHRVRGNPGIPCRANPRPRHPADPLGPPGNRQLPGGSAPRPPETGSVTGCSLRPLVDVMFACPIWPVEWWRNRILALRAQRRALDWIFDEFLQSKTPYFNKLRDAWCPNLEKNSKSGKYFE